jgi:hypothetical protein
MKKIRVVWVGKLHSHLAVCEETIGDFINEVSGFVKTKKAHKVGTVLESPTGYKFELIGNRWCVVKE